jgi:hypothetical protein
MLLLLDVYMLLWLLEVARVYVAVVVDVDTMRTFLQYRRCTTVKLIHSCVYVCVALACNRLNRMMAPPVPTADDYAAMQNDSTAPPTAGGLFPSGLMGGGGGGGNARSPQASSAPPPPPSSSEPFLETDGTTTFSTEPSAPEHSDGGSGWWPFGGGSS